MNGSINIDTILHLPHRARWVSIVVFKSHSQASLMGKPICLQNQILFTVSVLGVYFSSNWSVRSCKQNHLLVSLLFRNQVITFSAFIAAHLLPMLFFRGSVVVRIRSSKSFGFQLPSETAKTCLRQGNLPRHFHLQVVNQAIKHTMLKFYRPRFYKELKGRLNLFSLVLKRPHSSLKWLVALVNFDRLIYEMLQCSCTPIKPESIFKSC